jgi:hypothetical protein
VTFEICAYCYHLETLLVELWRAHTERHLRWVVHLCMQFIAAFDEALQNPYRRLHCQLSHDGKKLSLLWPFNGDVSKLLVSRLFMNFIALSTFTRSATITPVEIFLSWLQSAVVKGLWHSRNAWNMCKSIGSFLICQDLPPDVVQKTKFQWMSPWEIWRHRYWAITWVFNSHLIFVDSFFFYD